MRGRYCVSFAVLDAINNLRPQGTSVQQFNKCICDMKGTRYVVTSRAKGSTRATRSAFDKPHDEQARKTESRPEASGPIRLRSIAGDGPLHSECEAPPAAMPGSILWTTTAVEPSSPPTRVCNSELTFNVSNYAAGPCADCGSKSKHKRSCYFKCVFLPAFLLALGHSNGENENTSSYRRRRKRAADIFSNLCIANRGAVGAGRLAGEFYKSTDAKLCRPMNFIRNRPEAIYL